MEEAPILGNGWELPLPIHLQMHLFQIHLSYHAGAAISTGLKVLAYHGTRDSRSLWVLVQSFSSFGLLIAAHPGRVQSEFKVIDFLSVTAGDHQLKPPAQRRHPFYRNLAVVG